MADYQLKTPVVFLVFNRPETTRKVFDVIARAKPLKLLIVADGPRPHKEDDFAKCREVKQIFEAIDWPCQVHFNYSEPNLGCRVRVSSGLDWAFGLVDRAIVLEDDCLPSASFFQFCTELLERYEDDKRVSLISGNNFQSGNSSVRTSYYFSKYIHIWGWATWANRWRDSYDVNISYWPRLKRLARRTPLFGNWFETRYWVDIFDRVYQGKIDTWDYQLGLANFVQRRSAILPCVNLVSNIGFGAAATHTVSGAAYSNLEAGDMSFPLVHPEHHIVNYEADGVNYRAMFSRYSYSRLVRISKRMSAYFRLG